MFNLNFFVIVILLFFLFKNFNIMGTIENFVITPPPSLPKKQENWNDTYADQARHIADPVIHAPVLSNFFPMRKPPTTLETTPEGAVDLTRGDFIPHMAKRNGPAL
jgi:hypothetical protein